MPKPHRSSPPREMLADLRAGHQAGGDRLADALGRWELMPLHGGRNNHVYAWTQPDGRRICVKLYRADERQRAHREWAALRLLAAHGVRDGPAPLWYCPDSQPQAVGMTLLAGTPIIELRDLNEPLRGVAEAVRRIHGVPLNGPLARLDRIDSAAHYIRRLHHVWPRQLADAAADPLTPDMHELLSAWRDSGDEAVLAEPARPVFSQGDANLLNWLWTGSALRCVDFEFAGRSDMACDAADLVEHISARAIDDATWEALLPDLGIDNTNLRRFRAAQRTFALRWLAVLWKQRHHRTHEFHTQLQRTRHLQTLQRC